MKNRSRLVIVKLIFLFMALLIFTASAPAATLYVGSGETYTAIQAAVDGAAIDDTIVVRDGIYNENVTVNKPLTIESETGYENTILDVADFSLDGFQVTVDNVTIDGFTIHGANDSEKAGVLLLNVSYCSVINNRCGYKVGEEVRDNYYGIFLSGATACTVDNNICNYDDWYGIWLTDSSTGNIISNNNCEANFICGICVTADSNTILSNTCRKNLLISGLWVNGDGNIVDGNTCTEQERGDGITLQGVNGVVKNNLTSNNGLSGIYCNSIENYTIYYNSCISNQNGISLKHANSNLILLNDFNGNSRSNVNSSSSDNSWKSPLKIWYGYDRYGNLDPPYSRSHMGNYYSDHGFSDTDEDGICDTAYSLPDTEPDDDYPLFETTVDYGKDIDCYWDAEVLSTENLLILGDLTIGSNGTGLLTIEGTLTLGSI